MFADDIALLPLLPGYEGFTPLQQALTTMTRYASLWKITFSSKKTNLVYFHPYQSVGEWIHPPARFTLGGFTITPTKQYTYLGVILDNLEVTGSVVESTGFAKAEERRCNGTNETQEPC